MTPRFDYCRQLADEILLMQSRPTLFHSAKSMKYDRPIIFEAYQNYEQLTKRLLPTTVYEQKVSGGTIHIQNEKLAVILYDRSELNLRRRNWTLAHEVGHIYLEHKSNGEIEEIEANYFAAELLMPEIIVHRIFVLRGSLSERDICRCFNVTYSAAHKRLTAMRRKGSLAANPWLLDAHESRIKEAVSMLKYGEILDATEFNEMLG